MRQNAQVSAAIDPESNRPPTGRQVLLRHGDHEAVTVAVAAGLRSYTVAGRALVDGFDEDAKPTGGRGQTLAPWPNRIADGRYELDGNQQLALTEPLQRNAIHGLLRWVEWEPEQVADAEVTWKAMVVPQPGWPTSLECRVTYRLADDGLTVTTRARNVGAKACLYGTGAHPYLTAGTSLVDAATLRVPASTWYETDDRGIPVGTHPVTSTPYDFRTASVIGDRVLDTAYGDLERDADGRWHVDLTAPDGAGLSLWGDAAYGWVQVFTGDTLAADQRRRGVAVEPTTCPPNAFNADDREAAGVVRLEPGDVHVATWGITPR